MRRILLMAGAIAAGLMAVGLAACDPDDVRDLALPAVKAGAVKIAVAAASGDTRSRDVVLSTLSGYCEVAEADRMALRDAFSRSGAAAVTIDCAVVAALRPATAAADPPERPGPVMLPRFARLAALAPDPHRRE